MQSFPSTSTLLRILFGTCLTQNLQKILIKTNYKVWWHISYRWKWIYTFWYTRHSDSASAIIWFSTDGCLLLLQIISWQLEIPLCHQWNGTVDHHAILSLGNWQPIDWHLVTQASGCSLFLLFTAESKDNEIKHPLISPPYFLPHWRNKLMRSPCRLYVSRFNFWTSGANVMPLQATPTA